MKRVALTDAKNSLPRLLHEAERRGQPVLVTRHGRPVAILHPIRDEDDWLLYRLQHDPKLRQRLAEARRQLDRGEGVRLEDIPDDFWTTE